MISVIFERTRLPQERDRLNNHREPDRHDRSPNRHGGPHSDRTAELHNGQHNRPHDQDRGRNAPRVFPSQQDRYEQQPGRFDRSPQMSARQDHHTQQQPGQQIQRNQQDGKQEQQENKRRGENIPNPGSLPLNHSESKDTAEEDLDEADALTSPESPDSCKYCLL